MSQDSAFSSSSGKGSLAGSYTLTKRQGFKKERDKEYPEYQNSSLVWRSGYNQKGTLGPPSWDLAQESQKILQNDSMLRSKRSVVRKEDSDRRQEGKAWLEGRSLVWQCGPLQDQRQANYFSLDRREGRKGGSQHLEQVVRQHHIPRAQARPWVSLVQLTLKEARGGEGGEEGRKGSNCFSHATLQEGKKAARSRRSSSQLREQDEMVNRSQFFDMLEEREERTSQMWQAERELVEVEEELTPAFLSYLERGGGLDDDLTPEFLGYLGTLNNGLDREGSESCSPISR